MKTVLLHVIILIAIRSATLAQDTLNLPVHPLSIPDSTLVVDQILIQGNASTKDFVVLREMTLKPGSIITREALEYDQNRIYSLGLFTQVELHVIRSTPLNASILVIVRERWFIYPYPILGIKDRDWEKLYYGAGITHLNFRGRNEKLIASFVFGYDPGFSVSYRNPFLSQEGSYFIEGRIGSSKIRNKSLQILPPLVPNFDERHIFFSLTLGRRYKIEHTAWLTLGYEYIGLTNYVPQSTLSPWGEDRFIVLGAGYSYDTRDLQEYPGSGTFFRATITKSGIPSGADNVNVIRYNADERRFIPLAQDLVLAARLFTNLTAAGPTPSYQRVFFGYDERIRGHFNEVREGENVFGLSTELHFTILQPRYFTVGFLPSEVGVWRLGVTAAAFTDAGTIWFRSEPFALDRFVKGYGVGLHFLLPYSIVLRTEYALNEVRRGEFIIDVGSTF